MRTVFRRWLPWIAVFLATGCAEQPVDPSGDQPVDPSQVPPVPVDLAVEVTEAAVTLTWTVGDPTGVTGYRVYRATDDQAFVPLSSPAVQLFRDEQVVAGTTYRYQVTARRAGLEGGRSQTVTAVPGLFSIVLELGAEITGGNAVEPGSRKIRVGLVAPPTTVSFRVSEDSTLAGAPQQGFTPASPTAIFTLSPGDGRKTVFAQFQDIHGATSPLLRGSIRLDTKAVIQSVTEDSNGATLHVNDVLHIAARVDTTGGVAVVDVGDVLSAVSLFDDGTNGDPAPFDGSYERDFVISAGLEVVRGVVVASFTDQVGNSADPASAATRVTIAEPPGAVFFDDTDSRVVGAGVVLEWSRNDDADFALYRIFRSDPGSGSVTTGDDVVADIASRETLTLTDAGLSGGATYTWGIVAMDANGFMSPLDAITKTLQNDPQLSNPDVSPDFGTPSTVFQYSCTYRHAGNLAPTYVIVIVDSNQIYAMAKVGGGTNWVGGEVFQANANLATGGHTFHFEAVATDGSSGRNPAAGLVLGGPAVSP